MFTQSNLGIVTQAGIWLMPKPEAYNSFVYEIDDARHLPKVLDCFRHLALSGIVNTKLHMINDFVSMTILTQRIAEKVPQDGPLRDADLDALLGLCETTGCRRQRLLGYFDEAAEPCGNCDTCLHPPQVRDATESARKALSCVFRTGSRFGAGHIVDVLTGKATDKVKEWQHDQVSTFGIGTELDDKGWRTLIRQLVAHGALAVDHERYGALTLTEAARPLLRGEASFTMRLDVATPKKGRNVGSARKAADWPEATGAEAELLGHLRAWRASTAKERNVPAYVIFHDATLRDIARSKPDSIEALGTISGVGDRKLEAYGEEIIGLIAEHA